MNNVEVVAAVILRDAKVLLVVSKKHGDTVTPGGRVEPGETHEDAIRREVREETGLTVTAVGRCLGMEQRGAFSVHFYVTEVAPGEPVAGDDAASVRWGDARETKDRAWVLEAMVERLHSDLLAAHMSGRFLDAHAGKMRASLRWGEAPSPEEIEARAEIVTAGEGIHDLEASVVAMEAALAEAQRTRYRVSWVEKRNAVYRAQTYTTRREADEAAYTLRECGDLTGVEVERMDAE